jgi:CRISPR/Cas system-associated endoribonuclease Cas2
MPDVIPAKATDRRDAQPRHAGSWSRHPARSKKRVRRIQLDLLFFRSHAKELELQLKRLKLQRSSSKAIGTEVLSPRSVQQLAEKSPARSQHSVWNGIAERQLKERLRAERQRKELEDEREDLRDLAMALQKLLQRCDHQKVGLGLCETSP